MKSIMRTAIQSVIGKGRSYGRGDAPLQQRRYPRKGGRGALSMAKKAAGGSGGFLIWEIFWNRRIFRQRIVDKVSECCYNTSTDNVSEYNRTGKFIWQIKFWWRIFRQAAERRGRRKRSPRRSAVICMRFLPNSPIWTRISIGRTKKAVLRWK